VGKVEIIENQNDPPTITLDANSANISAGKSGNDGNLILKSNTGHTNVRLGSWVLGKDKHIVNLSGIRIFAPNDQEIIKLLTINKIGYFAVDDGSGDPSLEFLGEQGSLSVGSHINNGKVIIKDGKLREVITLDSKGGGKVIIKDQSDPQKEVFKLAAGDLRCGGNGTNGNLWLFPKSASIKDEDEAMIRLDGRVGDIKLAKGSIRLRGAGDIRLGGKESNTNGNILLYDDQNDNMHNASARIRLDGSIGKINVDRGEIHIDKGTIRCRDSYGNDSVFIDGVEGRVHSQYMHLKDKSGNKSITMDGDKGDIFLLNADCAEEFDISTLELSNIEPGMAMVLDDEGRLLVSSKPYDRRVVGVISGGGNIRPGIVLDKKESPNLRVPLAMLGKVFCKVDANHLSISVGDILTTSSNPGHAMKAVDPIKAFGAVIGKALCSMKNGIGLIPILVTLQ